MALAKEIIFDRQDLVKLPGCLALVDLPGIYQELCRDLPPGAVQRTKGKETRKGYDTDGFGYQWCIDLLNEVVGLGHWRINTREAFCDEGEYTSGRKAYEVGFDVTVQIGNWAPQGFEVLAETPCTPGGHVSSSKSDARKGAFTNAIKKALSFFGIGAAAYRGELDDDNLPPEGRTYGSGKTVSQNRVAGGSGNGKGTASGNVSGNGTGISSTATDEQIGLIKGGLNRAAQAAGYPNLTHENQGFLNAVIFNTGFNVNSLEELTRAQASQLINKVGEITVLTINKAKAAKDEKKYARKEKDAAGNEIQLSQVIQAKQTEQAKPNFNPGPGTGVGSPPGAEGVQNARLINIEADKVEQNQQQATTTPAEGNGRRRLF